MRTCLYLLILALFINPSFTCAQTPPANVPGGYSSSQLWLENMTWQEVRDAIKTGKTTVLIPTGGTEQNGPALALGKHNFILRYTTLETAKRLGNTLIAPIMPYVPEGDFHPPTGHMMFSGTLSLKPETFAAFLEDTARSLKEHGFKTICFIGEHGASQPVQKEVAEKLSKEWQAEGVRVIHVSNYYDPNENGQLAWLKSQGETETDPEAHGGLADTAEMLAAYPDGVRESLRGHFTEADMLTLGAGGSSEHSTKAMGDSLLELKIQGAVKQIRAASK